MAKNQGLFDITRLMLKLLASSEAPYTPAVMTWLSDRLGKKAGQIESGDIQALLKKG